MKNNKSYAIKKEDIEKHEELNKVINDLKFENNSLKDICSEVQNKNKELKILINELQKKNDENKDKYIKDIDILQKEIIDFIQK